MSRKSLFTAQVATKEKVKLMIGLTGPSGAGKTYSALQLAYGITGDWSKIALADTENGSAKYYAGERTGPWMHIDFPSTINAKGYHPDNWIHLIEDVESLKNIEVLILDSISHEWEGPGGCLDLANLLAPKGNTYAAYKSVTPMHDRFITKMRESKLHIIATMRSKSDYVLEQNEKGKASPKKVGMKSIQREGSDYEFGIIFDIDINHFCTSSKDRTGLFGGSRCFQITPDIGVELMAWANEGIDPIYTDTDNNKMKLLKILNELGIAKEQMRNFHNKLLGEKISDLKSAAIKYQETLTIEG